MTGSNKPTVLAVLFALGVVAAFACGMPRSSSSSSSSTSAKGNNSGGALGTIETDADGGTVVAEGSGCATDVTVPEQATYHVDAGQPVTYDHNPPASGPHWPIWAQYRIHDDDVPREVYVHNLEHGAIVLLAGASASSDLVDELRGIYSRFPLDGECVALGANHPRALIVNDAELDVAWAAVAWNHVLEGQCVDEKEIDTFLAAHRGHGPEDECADGTWSGLQ